MAADHADRPVVVRCVKYDGVRRVIFKRYTREQREQAEIDADGLRKLGIAAEVVDVDAAATRATSA